MFGLMSAVLLLNAPVGFFYYCRFLSLLDFFGFLFPDLCIVLETFPSIGRVRVKHRGILLTLKGTVVRSGAVKMIEGEKIYECRNCKHRYGLI